MVRLFLLCSLLLVAACDHSQRDADRCSGYGFSPGTEGYATCRMQVSENRRAMGATIAAQNPYLRP